MSVTSPLYRRIQAALRSALLAGEFPPGRPLPGEPTLAARFGAARMTLRRALAELEAEGLLRREAGRGTWPTAAGNLAGLRADMRRIADESAVLLLRCEARPAEAAPAPLGLPDGAAAFHITRVRRDTSGPFSHVDSWVPADALPGGVDEVALRAGRPLLEQLGMSETILHQIRQRILACAAGPEIAAALDIPIGSPLIQLDRQVADRAGKVVEFSRSLYRPDRYSYAVDLADGALSQAPHWESMRAPD